MAEKKRKKPGPEPTAPPRKKVGIDRRVLYKAGILAAHVDSELPSYLSAVVWRAIRDQIRSLGLPTDDIDRALDAAYPSWPAKPTSL